MFLSLLGLCMDIVLTLVARYPSLCERFLMLVFFSLLGIRRADGFFNNGTVVCMFWFVVNFVYFLLNVIRLWIREVL